MQLRRIVRGPTLLIGAYLAVQLLAPLGYYTAAGGDRRDDRFAWRLFTADPDDPCRARFLVGDERTPARLESTFDRGWIELAGRGRIHVVERMARHLCDRHPGKPVRVDLICRRPDGGEPERISGDWDVCLTGTVR